MKSHNSFPRMPALSVIGVSLLAFLTMSAPVPADAQARTVGKEPCIGCSADGKTTPKTADGKVDFSGFWNTPAGNSARQFERHDDGSILYEFAADFDEVTEVCVDDSCQNPNQPPYKPDVMPRVREIAQTQYLGTTPLDPNMLCKPNGIPRNGYNGMQVLQTPQVMAMLFEGAPSSVYRIVYLDGRPMPEDYDPSFWGFSSGRWDGDTLVITTTGFNEDTWLGSSDHGKAKYTSIHSDKMKVTERMKRQGNTLTVDITVEDPVMFTKPWVLPTRKVQISNPGDYIREAFCSVENTTQANIVKPTEKDKGQLLQGTKENRLGQ
jgi:hypothetical protein